MSEYEFKGTPGPYFIVGEDESCGGVPFIDVAAPYGDGAETALTEVCSNLEGDDFVINEEVWANACLLAASWDMYEALKAICEDLADGDYTSAEQIARHAGRAALQKATKGPGDE